jgi:2-methylcitrate dehydratase PrpD
MTAQASAPITRDLGAFVASVPESDVPGEALDIAKLGFTDCIGTLVAGSIEEAPRILLRVLGESAGRASVLLGPATAAAPEAALINGTAAHALDYDDVVLKGHPSTAMVPALLAEAEESGGSGLDLLRAYVAGYEVWADLVLRDPDQLHMKGWHPTGVMGSVATAAACAALLRLDAERSAHAIALGASGSAGLMANFGTMTKPFHAGQAARAGLLAARLARSGFTASLDALEHAQGFLAAISPAGRADRASVAKPGAPWRILQYRLGIKKYPMCYCTHRAIDGMLDLIAATPLAPKGVAHVVVTTSRRNMTVLRNARPQTGLEAKFSMQFAMASALVARRAGLAELTDKFVQRSDIQALLPKVTVVPDDRESADLPGYAPFDTVVVETADGRRLESRPILEAKGGPTLPLSRAELRAKFLDCVAIGRPDADGDRLFDVLQGLESVRSVGEITAALRPAGKRGPAKARPRPRGRKA